MQAKPTCRISIVALPLLAVCALQASSVPAMAQEGRSLASNSQPWRCSSRTLFGSYGGRSDGALLPAPGVSVEFRGLTIARFDGRGNVSWIEHTVIGGEVSHPGWLPASGTYTVNADCTGTMVINSPNSPVPLSLVMTVVDQGREVHTLLEAHAILSVFTRVD